MKVFGRSAYSEGFGQRIHAEFARARRITALVRREPASPYCSASRRPKDQASLQRIEMGIVMQRVRRLEDTAWPLFSASGQSVHKPCSSAAPQGIRATIWDCLRITVPSFNNAFEWAVRDGSREVRRARYAFVQRFWEVSESVRLSRNVLSDIIIIEIFVQRFGVVVDPPGLR
jgi:hypothetical protein